MDVEISVSFKSIFAAVKMDQLVNDDKYQEIKSGDEELDSTTQTWIAINGKDSDHKQFV